MCWNANVSLNTFLFSMFGISFAYFNSVIGLFQFLYFVSFASMQLLEHFAWNHLNNPTIIHFLSRVGLFLIFIQIPLFILQSNLANKLKKILMGMYLLFSLFCGFYFKIDFSMHKAQNGHLAWNWLNFPTFIVAIWVSFLFFIYLHQKQYVKFGLYLAIISSIYYTYYKTNTWGSLWCWITNALALKLIFQTFYNQLTNN
jgi:hypothetical protein